MSLSTKSTPLALTAAAAAIAVSAFAFAGSEETHSQAGAQIPVMANLTAQTATTSGSVTLYTVPAGKRLVIENIFGRTSTNCPNGVLAHFRTKFGITFMDEWVAFEKQDQNGTRTTWTFNHFAKIYCEPNSNVEFRIGYKTATPNSSFTGGFSGYLIDKP